MKLYNTLSRKIETFNPLDPQKVSLYTCGPTVYDYQHIGNYSIYIRWDTLYRALTAEDYRVNWYMNITDVGHLVSDEDEGEDKLVKAAKRESKTAWEVAKFYTEDFLTALNDLNISIPRDNLPVATAHIEEQINLILELERKGFTYRIDDGVYFDTSKLNDYGKLARLNIEDLKAGARVAFNNQKRNITDFALWKFSPTDTKRDMEWESPWGIGFPGWHIECSAMSMKYLGETLDIHAGGIDHIPVHHTNEIAQSEAATGKPFANMWLHSNFILINGTKISKSLKNFFTLHDLRERGFSPLDLRMLVLQSHYRSEASFTWENLEAARNRRKDLQALADLRWQPRQGHASEEYINALADAYAPVYDALQDDLNTPQLLAELSTRDAILRSEAQLYTEGLTQFIKFLDRLLGLDLMSSSDINEEQKALLTTRHEAREQSQWTESDRLRDLLAQNGVGVRDMSHGQVWYRL